MYSGRNKLYLEVGNNNYIGLENRLLWSLGYVYGNG